MKNISTWKFSNIGQNSFVPQGVPSHPKATKTAISQPASEAATVPKKAKEKAATGTRKTKDEKRSSARERLPHEWIEPYLEALALTGLKMRAYERVGVEASTVMRYRIKNPSFQHSEELAMKRALHEVIEPEIARRVLEGKRRVRYDSNGKVLFEEREFSDTLLLRLAEQLETGFWRQKQRVEHSGGVTFNTRADRLAALEKMREDMARDHGRN